MGACEDIGHSRPASSGRRECGSRAAERFSETFEHICKVICILLVVSTQGLSLERAKNHVIFSWVGEDEVVMGCC